jgi:protein-tyrosine phosphatase
MIDLHTHVLPGIDDGPATLQGSLALARAAVAGGTRVMVATPHVTWDHPENTAARIAEGVRDLRRALDDEGIALDVRTGGEVAMTRAIDLDDTELQALRLGGGPWLLVECPFSPATAAFEAILHGLAARGHRILLAHPERCPAFQRDPELLAGLAEAGMLAQVTATSLSGAFGREAQRTAHGLLRRGLVHDVASDAHDAVHRPPGIRAALESAGLGAHADRLGREIPGAILAGSDIPAAPAAESEERGLLRRLLG